MARIRHLAIVSENRERLVKFYTEAFGMKVIDGVGPAIYLTDGYINLAIVQKRPHSKDASITSAWRSRISKPCGRCVGRSAPRAISKNARPTGRPSTGSPTPTAT